MNNIKLIRYTAIIIAATPLHLACMTSPQTTNFIYAQPVVIVPQNSAGKNLENMVVNTIKPFVKRTQTQSKQEHNEWNLAKTLFAPPEYALVKSILYTQEAMTTDDAILERLKKATDLSEKNNAFITQLEWYHNQLNKQIQTLKKRVAVKPIKSKKNTEELEEEFYCSWLQASAETFKAQTNQLLVALPNTQLSASELTEKRKALLANRLIDLAEQRSTIAKKNYLSRLKREQLAQAKR